MATTQKVSISVDASDLKWMRQRARRRGGSLSSVFSEAARLLRQREARDTLVRELGEASQLTPADRDEIDAEWQG